MTRSMLRCVVACLVALVAVAGCGLTLDDEPRVIATDDLPSELRPGQLPAPTPLDPSEAGPGSEQIYMIQDGNRLVTVERQIVDTPEAVMNNLLLGTFPVERAENIETAIYRGTEVQGIEVNELLGLAIVDLAEGSLNTNNSEQRLAFAQIVYSLTSLPGIDQVQFIQSDPDDPDAPPTDLPVQTDEGTTAPGARVSRADFAELRPTATTASPSFDIPIETPTPTVDPDTPLFDLAVWMLDADDNLVKVERLIEATPDAHLVSLLEGPRPEERERNIRSAVPPDALANPIEIGNYDVIETDEFGFESLRNLRIATVDFEPGSLPPFADGNEQYLAVAQIVMTLTQLAQIDQVAISVDGVYVPMPIDGEQVSLPFEPNITGGVDQTDYQAALGIPPTPAPEGTPTDPDAATPGAESGGEPAADASPSPGAEPTPTP